MDVLFLEALFVVVLAAGVDCCEWFEYYNEDSYQCRHCNLLCGVAYNSKLAVSQECQQQCPKYYEQLIATTTSLPASTNPTDASGNNTVLIVVLVASTVIFSAVIITAITFAILQHRGRFQKLTTPIYAKARTGPHEETDQDKSTVLLPSQQRNPAYPHLPPV